MTNRNLSGCAAALPARSASRWRSPRTRFGNLLIVAAVGAAEIAIGFTVLGERLPLDRALVLHALLTGALLLTLVQALQAPGADGKLLFAALAIVALGPLGAVVALLTALFAMALFREGNSYGDWCASLFPDEPRSAIEILYERVVLRGGGLASASSVAPFSDVMSSGTAAQKQTVITLIADNFRPEYAPTLQRALNDPDTAIRVQAASASASIESRFLADAMALARARQARPDDAGAVLAMARHCDVYASSGLLDSSRARATRNEALSLYQQYDRLLPGDAGVDKAIGRLLLRLECFEQAMAWLEPRVSGGHASPQLLAWYVEGLFRLRRWQDLRDCCTRFRRPLLESPELGTELREAFRMWIDGGIGTPTAR